VSAQPSLFDLIEQRLKEHYASTLSPNVGLPRAAANAVAGGLWGLPYEAGKHVGADITGTLYALSSRDSADPLDRRIADAYQAGGPAAAFTAATTDPRKEVSLTAGALGMAFDPISYVGGPLGKLGKVGKLADVVLGAPFKPLELGLGAATRLGPRLGKAVPALTQGAIGAAIGAGVGDTPEERAKGALIGAGLGGTLGYKSAAAQLAARDAATLRARQALYGATEGVAGNVPKSAGLIGPVPPPPLRTPPPLVPGPTSILDLARGGVPPAEVARVAPLPEALAPTRAPSLLREALGARASIPAAVEHGPAIPESMVTPSIRGNVPKSAGPIGPPIPEAMRTPGRPGNVPKSARMGPFLPPVAPVAPLAPEQLREALGNLAARRMTTPPPEAVTLAEERAVRPQPAPPAGVESPALEPIAPQEPVQRATGASEAAPVDLAPTTREAGLAALSGRDTNTLLSIAYDHPNAVANAQRKYAEVGALRARAIERIQADRGRVARLAEADPDLAARVAALPDAEAEAAATGVPGAPLVTPLAAARTLGPGAAEASGRALSNLGITGSDLRAAGGAGVARMRAARATEAAGIATPAQATAAGVDRYTRGARGPVEAVNDFLNQTRGVVVATWKNQVLDVLHTRGMLREFSPTGADPAGTMDTVADELRANEGAADAYGKLSDTARTTLEGWGFKGFLPDLGQGQVGALAQEEPGRILPATQRVINGMVMEFRTKGPLGLLTFPAGGARGYFAPFLDAFFERLNRLPQRAGRETLYTLTGDANSFLAAHNFLGSLAQRGVDVTTLAGRRFTPEDVEALAGTQAANEWRSLLATVWGGAEAETKRVLGDFGAKTALEKVPLIGRMFWLAGWSQRMLPIYAQVAARHPGVSMAVGGALANQAQGLREQGLPPWAVGGIDTPLGRVNLLSPMPFSGELAGEALSALGGGGDEGDQQTGYQKFKGIAGGLGLPLNPLIETGAYIAGQTGNQRPGDLDRYAGVENAILPGPTVGIDYGAMLDKARQIVTGLEAGDLAAGKKPPASEADKEFARLVAERTGLPLSDPRNIGAVIDSLADDPNTLAAQWRKEAEANVAGRQGKQGVVSAVSPLTISRIDPLQRAAAIGRQNQPYSYEQISAAYDAGQKKQAQAMTKANAASKAPNQRVYEGASEAQRTALVKSWLTAIANPPRVPLETDMYGLRRTGAGADLSGLGRR
jgi:hypothetical protein